MSRSLCLACLTFICAITDLASAQTRWVPVLHHEDATPEVFGVLNQLQDALRERADVELADPAVAGREFEAKHSQSPSTLSETELQQVAFAVRSALKQAAAHRPRAVEHAMAPFWKLREGDRDYAAFRMQLTQDLIALCLQQVQEHLAHDHLAGAQRQAQICAEAYPAGLKNYPLNEAVRIFDGVRGRLLARGSATLHIEAQDAEGCTVIVQGQGYEFSVAKLAPGTNARVQLHCSGPGRIYQVPLHSGEQRIAINARFDQAVRSAGFLGLQYDQTTERHDHYVEDSKTLAVTLKAAAALYVERTQNGHLTLARIDPDQGLLAYPLLTLPVQQAELDAVVEELLLAPAPVTPAEVVADGFRPAPPRDDSRSYVPLIAGLGTFALGAAATTFSWTLYDLRMQYRAVVADDREDFRPLYVSVGRDALLVAAGGAALLSASHPLLLADYDRLPWLPWVVGGVGGVGAAIGAYLTATAEPCRVGACGEAPDLLLGPLVLTQSLGLLTLPLTYAIRELLDFRTGTVGVSGGAQHGSVRVDVAFRSLSF